MNGRLTAAKALSRDGKCLLAFGMYNIDVIDAASGEKLVTIFDDRSGGGLSKSDYDVFAFSPDGKHVLLSDTATTLWNFKTGKKLSRLQGINARLSSVDFSPDGVLLITGFDTPRIFDDRGPDWKKIAQDRSHEAVLWDVESGKAIRSFEGHTDGVNSVSFGMNGRLVLTGSGDGTCRICGCGNGRRAGPAGQPRGGKDWSVG